MLNLLRRNATAFEALQASHLPVGWQLPAETIWIDLFNPSREEELAVEQAIGLDLPTADEVAQIEPSSRLYQESGATFMTASILVRRDAQITACTP